MWFVFLQSALPSLIQVDLPRNVEGRLGHSATVFGSGPNFRQVVMVGGQKNLLSGSPIAETTLLNFGKTITSWRHYSQACVLLYPVSNTT